MKLKLIDSSTSDIKAKCNIYKDGGLGFNPRAIELMDLTIGSMVSVYIDEENKDCDLYLRVEAIKGAFKMHKNAAYLYIHTTKMFDDLCIDYKKENIMFDIVKVDDNLYKLNKRVIPRKPTK